jgi:hypothetical protein
MPAVEKAAGGCRCISGVRSAGNGTGVPMHSVDSAIAAHDQANSRSQSFWSSAIRASWQKSTAGIIETGELLLQAREQLDRDVFAAMKLPFGQRTAQRLMAIAQHPVLSDATHVSRLPPSWGTLYELTKLPCIILRTKVEDGTIHPGMERKDVAALLNKSKRLTQKPKFDLLTAWAAAGPEARRALFDQIGAGQLLGLISSTVRAKLTELLERQLASAAVRSSCSSKLALHGTMSAALHTALSLLGSIDESNSSDVIRKANTYQLLTALRTLNKTIQTIGGRKEPAITVVDAGTIEALRNPHKKKRRQAA